MAVMLSLMVSVVVLIVMMFVINRWQVKKRFNNDLKRPVSGVVVMVLGLVVVQFVALTAQGQGDEAKSGDEQQWFDLHGELLI